jgi:hypothetical protein
MRAPMRGFTLTVSDPSNGFSLFGLKDRDPGTGGLQLEGTAAEINAALAAGRFKALADGTATLELSLSNGLAPAVTSTVYVNASNAAPTLTQVNALVGATEDVAYAVTFAQLQAAGNALDAGGSVTGFQVTSVDSTKGSLSIGGTPWNASTNNRIDADTAAVWTPAANLSGTGTDALAAFEVKALDDGGLSSATALSVKINVAAVNDAPVLTGVPGSSVAILTGQSTALADFTVSDVDNSTLSVTLSAKNGTLGNLTDADSNRNGIQLNGSASVINTALAGATFTAATNGGANFLITVEDGSPNLTVGKYGFSATTANSAPTLSSQSTPRAVTTGLGDSLGYITVSDADAGQNLALTLTPSGGSLKGLNDADPNVAGIQVSGTVIDLNAALANATFVAGADGAASISVSAADGVASAVTNTYNINATNAAPTLTQVNALSGGTEDLTKKITFAELQGASDASDAGGSVTGFEVTSVDSTKGSLSIGGNPWNASTNNRIDADTVAEWTPAADLNGTGTDAIAAFAVKALDDGGLSSATALSVKLNVAAVNDAPVLTGVPGSSVAILTGQSTALADFTVSDVDDSTLSVSLSASNGTIGNLTDADSNRSGIQLNGSASAINTALADATFTAATDGAAGIVISVEDGSPNPTLGKYSFSATTPNSAPTLSSPGTPRAVTTGVGESLGYITVSDADAGQNLTLTLTPSGGSLKGLNDADPNVAGIQVSGTVTDLNAALAAATFVAGADGAASITVSADDRIASAATNTYNLNATNAAPTLTQVGALSGGTEDLTKKITFAELQASSDASDAGGSVTGFRVTSVDSTKGSLSIGGNPWNASTNNRIDADTSAVWTPAADLNGTGTDAVAAFEVKALDDGGLGSATALSVKINVAAVNDAPVLTGVPGSSVAILTGQSTALADFTVSDVDDSTLSVSLSATNGTIGNLTDADSNRSGIQLNGSASAINTALAGATFTAATDGAAGIAISVEDGSPNPTLGKYSFSATTLNSAPTLSSPGTPRALTTGLGESLGYITVGDADAGQKLTLSLSASGGSIKGLNDADPNLAGIQVAGTVSDLNAALAAASFVAGADGAASITVSADDGVASAVTNTYNLNATNAAPTFTQVNALSGATEDLTKKITFAELQVASDASDSGGSVTGFQVTSVDSTKGSLSIGGTPWNASTNNRIDADTVAEWTPAADLNGTGTDAVAAFEVKALDDGGLGSATALSVKINVAAVNDAPVLTGVPGSSVAILTGQSTALADFTVSDVDDSTLSVTLSAKNGTLGNLTDADSNRSGIQLNGSASAINTALAGATFTAATDGAAGIAISVEDGSPNPTLGKYSFSATTLNSAPTLSSPGTPRALTTGLGESLGYITVGDADAGQKLTLSLSASGGSLKGLNDADPNLAGIQVAGTVSDLNAALAAASFVAGADGAASISVSANDGVASAVTNTYNINATNAAPTLTQVNALSGATEDLTKKITFAELQGASDASDTGGSVTGFQVTSVDSTKGILSIGGSAWNASTNNRIDADTVAEWTPAADLNGTGTDAVAAFEVKALDDGGLGSATALSVKINVAAVNDAPTLSGSYAFAGTTEDAPTTAVRVSSLLNGSSPTRSATDKTDETASAALGLALTGSTGIGNWQFSTDATLSGSTVWQSVGSVSDQNALLLGPDTWVRYQPDATNTPRPERSPSASPTAVGIRARVRRAAGWTPRSTGTPAPSPARRSRQR